jgi:pimeloyl-ACP methyl ester carboxylesterase
LAVKIVLLFAALLVGAGVFVHFRAAAREAEAEREYPPEGQFLTVNGTRVHAVVMGEGPDLVLIHGASGNTRDMTFSLAPRLAERYRVLVFDRPGLGYTERLASGPASLRDQADLLSAAAAQLGAERPIVLGQSYGGGVALAWAVYHPEALSALVPVSAVSNPWTTPLDPFYRVTSSWWGSLFVVPVITAFVSKSRIADTVRSIFKPQGVPDGYLDHVGAGLTLRRVSLRANAAQRATLLDEIEAQYRDYGRIDVPTEIVHGDADTTVGLSLHSAKLVDQIPAANLTVLPGVGHMPHHVAEDEVVAAIDRAAARAGL